jgi:putative ABC transport system ATP-binding protein/lipoprotein-releasing system ATP-binding protein
MISLQNVTKTYDLGKDNRVTAVADVSLEIRAGEFAVITGRSGSGKTTLLNLAAGLTRPTSGLVLLDGQNLWRLPDQEQSLLRNSKIGFIFQFPSLLPSLTVLENAVLPVTFGSSAGRDDAPARARRLLDLVGLADKLNAYPRPLSAGQQQRVVIARALLNQPRLLLADEPTSNLDEQTEREIMELFAEIHKGTGITIVLVTHTQQLVSYGTRAVSMAGGKVM